MCVCVCVCVCVLGGQCIQRERQPVLKKEGLAQSCLCFTLAPLACLSWGCAGCPAGTKSHHCSLLPQYPQLFTGILSPWKGLLLYGPPGKGIFLLWSWCEASVQGMSVHLSSLRDWGSACCLPTSCVACVTVLCLWAEGWSSRVAHVLPACVSRYRKDFTGQSCGYRMQNHLL